MGGEVKNNNLYYEVTQEAAVKTQFSLIKTRTAPHHFIIFSEDSNVVWKFFDVSNFLSTYNLRLCVAGVQTFH
jgi:hypothetical protein